MKKLLGKAPIRFVAEMVELYFSKGVSRSAAELAYFLILSLFPILICINSFIGLLHLDIHTLLSGLKGLIPAGTLSIILDYVDYISTNQSATMLAAGLVMTLFSASAAFRALMNSMADIYGRKSYSAVWQVVASLFFSALLLATIYLSLVVLLTGSWLFQLIEDFFRLSPGDLPWDWQWLRFFLLFALVFLFVLIVYRMAAPRGKPRPPLFTGALIASVALVASSILFSWFIGMSTRYSLVYGSITSIIILMVWLYLCGNVLILGGVFNSVWYRHKKQKMLRELELREKKMDGPR